MRVPGTSYTPPGEAWKSAGDPAPGGQGCQRTTGGLSRRLGTVLRAVPPVVDSLGLWRKNSKQMSSTRRVVCETFFNSSSIVEGMQCCLCCYSLQVESILHWLQFQVCSTTCSRTLVRPSIVRWLHALATHAKSRYQ